MKKLILVIFILFCSFMVNSQSGMTVKMEGVSIESPIGWLAQYTKSPQVFFLYSPLEVGDTFQENCNLTTEYLSIPLTIDEYKSAGIEAIREIYGDFKLLKSDSNYHIISGFVGGIEVQQIQYMYIENNIAYVLTFSSNPENFERYLEQFHSIAKTFKIE